MHLDIIKVLFTHQLMD